MSRHNRVNGQAQHLWFSHALLPQGWVSDVRVGVQNGLITAVDEGVVAEPADQRHGPAIAGLCNLHSHAFQRGIAGLSERAAGDGDDFWSWREIMYRFLERMSPNDIQAISALAYSEMLEGGFTRVGEFHYVHHQPDGRFYDDPAETAGAIVAAAEAAGIGLTLLPVFYAHGDFGGAEPATTQRRFVSDVDLFARLVESARSKLPPDATLGIAPHSLRAVTPEELAAIVPLAPKGPIHIHAAEQQREVDACLAWSGARPVAWLLDHADIDDRWCIVHATHVDATECVRLAASGAVAGLCPQTEANLGDGIFPAVDYLASQGRFGVGTDSNILIDAPAELRTLEYSQRLTHQRRAMLASDEQSSVGHRLVTAAQAGGAQALGVETGLAVGRPADIVSFDADHVALAESDVATMLDRWIFAARGGLIDGVWRSGRKVVAEGRHVAADAIGANYRRTLERLLA
jgi:formiminoglutamate deiminase